MHQNLPQKITITIAIVTTFVVNMLAVLLPLNGIRTATVSETFNVFFVPANYVFSIWSLIYLGLMAFLAYQWMLKDKEFNVIKTMTPWVVISCVANAIWLFTWHYYAFNLGLIVMLILLISLIITYLKIQTANKENLPKRYETLIKLPFSIYLGWISVATIANFTDVLWLAKWDGFGISGAIWSAIMIIIAAILALAMIYKFKDYAYAGVIVWAIIGIAQKFPQENAIVIATLIAVFAIIIIAVIDSLKQYKVLKK